MADYSGLGGIYGGFLQGQDAQAAIQQKQQQIQAFKDDQDSLALLGNAFGVQGPQPPAPGQASQPAPQQAGPSPQMQPGGPAMAPGVPIGVGAPAPGAGPPPGANGLPGGPPALARPPGPPGAPQGLPAPPQAPPPQQQPQPGVGGLSQGPQPQPSQAPPQQGPQAAGGMLSLDQLAKKILSAPGNAQKIQQNPGLLVRALEKGQALLAPEGRAELAQAKGQLEQEKANTSLYKIQQDAANKLMQAQSAEDRTRIMNDSREKIAAARQAGADAAHADAVNVALMHLAQGDRKLDQNDQKRRDGAIGAAAKAGVEVPEGASVEDIQKLTAKANAQKYASSLMPPEVVAFTGDAALTDPSILSHAFGGKSEATTANKNAVLAYIAKKASPEVLAQAKVALQEKSSEGRSIGTIAGPTAVGAAEIDQFSQPVLDLAKKVNISKYPTINSIVNAAKRKTGDADIIEYGNRIQALKSAAVLVLTRGGLSSDKARARVDEIINDSMGSAQIPAAIKALKAEAAGVGQATKAATAGTVGAIKTPGATAPPEDAPTPDDPLGILK